MYKLEEYIQSDHIFFDLKAGSKRGILKAMVKLICETERIPDQEEILFSHIMDREKVESTGIGESLAIPHCHYDGFSGVKVFVGFPKAPIEFKSVDGNPVRVIFMIISDNNSNDIYLKTLSRLMYLFRNIQVRDKLYNIRDKDEFLKIIRQSDEQINYISFEQLKRIVELLEVENEIETCSKETIIEKGKRLGKADLKDNELYKKLLDNRETLVQTIDKRLLHIYEQLKSKYDKDILSRVVRNVCSFCNVQLPVHIIREINRQNQIIQCSTCAKILVRGV